MQKSTRHSIALGVTLAALAACAPLNQTQRISECGGFDAQSQALSEPGSAYCDAEVLTWEYQPARETLILTDKRIPLNCCGEHSMTVQHDGTRYLVTERDAPESIGPLPGTEARCGCMCVFDYQVEVGGVPEEPIEIELVREITDNDEPRQVVWRGTLDLREGAGRVVLDPSDAEPWCSGEVEEG